MHRALAGSGVAALALAALVAGSFAQSSAVVITDARGDLDSGRMDLARVSLQRASDGKLRAAITLHAALRPASDLRAEDGSPGSICLRVFTTAAKRPGSDAPDYLVCATATSTGRLRGGVFRERTGDLPARVADATAAQPSPRTVVVRFAQSSVGRPQRLRFVAETVRANCARISCIDTAPDQPGSRSFTLRPAAG